MDFPTYTPDDEVWWRAQLIGEAGTLEDRMAWLGVRLGYATLGPQQFWELAKQEDEGGTLQPSKVRRQLRQTALASFSDELLPVAQLYEELRRALLTP